jgi:N utilization substance protein B
MGYRRKSRELALQALFCMDMNQDTSQEMLERFCAHFIPSPEVGPFFLILVEGVVREKEKIDRMIEKFSRNWKLDRMSCVDRNVMRIAVYEILFCEDIPPKVSINEAIDIGKKYGTEESGAFINGIVDSVRIACGDSGVAPEPVNTES